MCTASAVVAVVGALMGAVLFVAIAKHSSHTLADFLFGDVQRVLQCVREGKFLSSHLSYVVMLRVCFYFWCADLVLWILCLRGRNPFRFRNPTEPHPNPAIHAEAVGKLLYKDKGQRGSASLGMEYLRLAVRLRTESCDGASSDGAQRMQNRLLSVQKHLERSGGSVRPRLQRELNGLLVSIDAELDARPHPLCANQPTRSGMSWPTE